MTGREATAPIELHHLNGAEDNPPEGLELRCRKHNRRGAGLRKRWHGRALKRNMDTGDSPRAITGAKDGLNTEAACRDSIPPATPQGREDS